jgi:hypothetical protein
MREATTNLLLAETSHEPRSTTRVRKGGNPYRIGVPIVGGTGVCAGATGVVDGSHLASGVTLEVLHVQIP